VGRILSVDLGTKRVGLALSDPGKRIASPFDTIEFTTFARIADRLRDVCAQKDVELVVIGLPLREDGSEGEGCTRARLLEGRLAAMDIRCRLWDESWSSREAEDILKSTGKNRKQAAGKTDAVAASLVLKDFLESDSR
jgi:putative Holliday junction resolvase